METCLDLLRLLGRYICSPALVMTHEAGRYADALSKPAYIQKLEFIEQSRDIVCVLKGWILQFIWNRQPTVVIEFNNLIIGIHKILFRLFYCSPGAYYHRIGIGSKNTITILIFFYYNLVRLLKKIHDE